MISTLKISISQAGKPHRHKKCTQGPNGRATRGAFAHKPPGIVGASPKTSSPPEKCNTPQGTPIHFRHESSKGAGCSSPDWPNLARYLGIVMLIVTYGPLCSPTTHPS